MDFGTGLSIGHLTLIVPGHFNHTYKNSRLIKIIKKFTYKNSQGFAL